MARRLFDIACAASALIVLAPVFVAAWIGIRVSSPGPVLFRAKRIGRGEREFTMLKFRSMHTGSEQSSPITSAGDTRIFPFGRFLRGWKVDELPQLVNVLVGDMSIIGPRPEHPDIVREHYSDRDRETLSVRPGLASPGSIYNYTHGESSLVGGDVASQYVDRLMPIKLGLDRIYVQRASILYDVRIVGRTVGVLVARACGRQHFEDPPEMSAFEGHTDCLPREQILPIPNSQYPASK